MPRLTRISLKKRNISRVPGKVYGTIVERLAEFAAAPRDIWRAGGKEETLSCERMA